MRDFFHRAGEKSAKPKRGLKVRTSIRAAGLCAGACGGGGHSNHSRRMLVAR